MTTTISRRTIRTAAVGALVPLALALAGCGSDGSDSAAQGSADEASSAQGADDTASGVTELSVASAGTARCAMPTPELLAGFDTAFEGTVTSVEDGTATLSVDTWYAGAGTDTVTVTAPSQEMQDLLLAVDFEEGTTYLVSASDGDVSLCGYTAEQDDELQELYETAFAQ